MNILLETERLRLRELTEEDAGSLFALDSDPEVMRFIGPVISDPTYHTQWLRERVFPYYAANPGYGFFAAEEKATGAFIGWFILRPAQDFRFASNVKFTANDIEVGYRLLHAFWGHGFGTEGARALMDHAFVVSNAAVVAAVALKTNYASWHIMEKIGMQRSGEYTIPGYDTPAVVYRRRREASVRTGSF